MDIFNEIEDDTTNIVDIVDILDFTKIGTVEEFETTEDLRKYSQMLSSFLTNVENTLGWVVTYDAQKLDYFDNKQQKTLPEKNEFLNSGHF